MATIVLERPQMMDSAGYTTNLQTGKVHSRGSFRKPRNVKVNEPFYVKIQGNTAQSPLMIYDKSRECQFYYSPGQRGFSELLAKVQADPCAGGRKTYLAASFDAAGNCTIHTGICSTQKW